MRKIINLKEFKDSKSKYNKIKEQPILGGTKNLYVYVNNYGELCFATGVCTANGYELDSWVSVGVHQELEKFLINAFKVPENK